MTILDRTALLDIAAKAKAASPGPWHWPGGEWLSVYEKRDGDEEGIAQVFDPPRNAPFIAAANPAVVTSLIERLIAAEEALDPDGNDAWADDDEALVDAFHAELKRQGAFSVEHYATVALAMSPFIKAAFQSIARRARAQIDGGKG